MGPVTRLLLLLHPANHRTRDHSDLHHGQNARHAYAQHGARIASSEPGRLQQEYRQPLLGDTEAEPAAFYSLHGEEAKSDFLVSHVLVLQHQACLMCAVFNSVHGQFLAREPLAERLSLLRDVAATLCVSVVPVLLVDFIYVTVLARDTWQGRSLT